MARYVNLEFGGRKDCNWDTVGNVLTTYNTIALDNGLIKPRHGFNLIFDDNGIDLVGVDFRFEKQAMIEANLQTFNETWFDLSVTYTFTRGSTVVTYYEGP